MLANLTTIFWNLEVKWNSVMCGRLGISGVTLSGNQQATIRRDQAFRVHSETTERLKKAVVEFRQDEVDI